MSEAHKYREPDIDDEIILDAKIIRDPDALATLMKEIIPVIQGIAEKYADYIDVDDVVQDILVKLMEKELDNYDLSKQVPFTDYVAGITQHHIQTLLKSQEQERGVYQQLALSSDESPISSVIDFQRAEWRILIAKMVEDIGDEEREALLITEMQDVSPRRFAMVRGIRPVERVGTLKEKARKAARANLSRRGVSEPSDVL